MLAASGFHRTSQQVINKLKALKRNFHKVHDHNRNRSGAARMEWQYYEQCATIFGHTALATPVSLSSSIAAAETRQACAASTCSVQDPDTRSQDPDTRSPPPPSPLLVLDDTQPMPTTMPDPVVQEPSRTETTDAPEDTEAGPSQMAPIAQTQPLRGNIYTVPPRRRRPNKTEQAARIMTTVLVEKLEQMDAAMADREDARLERFLQAEQDMNNTFMTQLISMQETYNRDARERQREMQEFQMSIFDRMFQCIEGLHTVPPNYPQPYTQYYPVPPYYDHTPPQPTPHHTHPRHNQPQQTPPPLTPTHYTHPRHTQPQQTPPPLTPTHYTHPRHTQPQHTQSPSETETTTESPVYRNLS
ncbi:basic-leucine zipper transcription factor A-like [Pseudophryne corroboree]|uniref:basic-leucine zipper transcription factor A-like n=1 Tax=Pseudophryne corroboree TaxID=495146 RepID=UPI0030812832